MGWLEITFDPAQLGEDQNVVMTLNVVAADHRTVSAHRVEHKKGEASKMRMIVAVRKENIENSALQVLVPGLLSKGIERTNGDPGFGGYTLSLGRIAQLAAEPPADEK